MLWEEDTEAENGLDKPNTCKYNQSKTKYSVPSTSAIQSSLYRIFFRQQWKKNKNPQDKQLF